ncbi:hypothetical protein VPH46_01845 [Sphingomonas sp. MJ1 (PH-R8)]|uniref:hypothetical protein n=1 Tax=Sphingomonas sp. MJ1 (PH-R8) TaxID=3112950 RepID=UPI003A883F8A
MKLLPIETVNAVWRAALPNRVPSERQAEVVGEWLARALERAERNTARDKRVALTRKDVSKVESAYKRFQTTLLSLQDRDYPPPMIPETEGVTDWEYWIGSNNLDFKRGRDAEYDWTLIGVLLQLYEAITGNAASGAAEGGPTMRFLDNALEALSRLATPESQHAFQSPSGDAVDRELKNLRSMWNGLRHPHLRGLRDI